MMINCTIQTHILSIRTDFVLFCWNFLWRNSRHTASQVDVTDRQTQHTTFMIKDLPSVAALVVDPDPEQLLESGLTYQWYWRGSYSRGWGDWPWQRTATALSQSEAGMENIDQSEAREDLEEVFSSEDERFMGRWNEMEAFGCLKWSVSRW